MECYTISLYEGNVPPATITSVSPSTFVVGHSYKVLVTGVFTGNASAAIDPGCVYSEARITKGDESSDPYVTISNYDEPSAFVSSTQMIFDVKVKDGASTGTYTLSMTCDGNCPLATAPIQIKGCADETITSVSPSIWFAGKAYKTTITGTNFITKDKATKLCPVSKVDATATSSNVSVSDVTVVSDTKITATIKPAADSPIEPGTVTVDSVPSNTTIIDNEVQWNNQGTLQNIAGIFATDVPQQAVVGQQIILTTNPNLPANITVTDSTWTVGGTRIAGYTASSSASVQKLTDADLKNASITFYWVYPTDSTVTYNYCVNIPGLSADDIASKLNCSLTEKATFDVAGVTSPSIGFFNEFLAHINTLAACDGVGGGTYLVYGNVYGQPNPCPLNGTPGITFYPYGSPPESGNMFFVQIVNRDDVDYLIGEKVKESWTVSPGLDGDYPYHNQYNPTSVIDAPYWILSSNYTTVTRNFSATMYLFWQSTSTSGSIPVPLAYIPWTFSADANLLGGTWSAGGGGAPVLNNSGQSNLSDPSQPNYGYPTWTGPAILKYKTK
jgi:hypothetical protein